MRVQHNIPAMNSYRNYNNNAKSINKNLEKLSSGYRINRAGDDAAGLAISEKMRAQITGLEVAQKNAKDGISLVQTAEGALTEVHDMLNRMYSLAEQAGNGTYDNSVDRNQLNKEVEKLRQEIDRIGNTTNFNGTKLFAADVTTSGVDGVKSTIANNTLEDGVSLNITGKLVTKVTNSATTPPTTANFKEFQIIAPKGYTISTTGTTIATSATTSAGLAIGTISGQSVATARATATGTVATVNITLTSTTDSDQKVDLTIDLSNFDPDGTGQTGSIDISAVPPDYEAPTDATTAQGKQAKTVALSGSGIDLWVGDFPDSNNKINVQMGIINSEKLVIDSEHVNLTSQEAALNSLSYIKDAIDYVSDMRGTLGAAQNRLEHTINNLSVMQENIQDAESTIRDTDVAEEMMKYTKNSILVQSAQAMLAQANQQPQSVLQLLQ